MPQLKGERKAIYPHVFGYLRDFQRMIRTDEWKYNYDPHLNRSQLFHLTNDPFELTDLSGNTQYGQVQSELRTKLEAWQRDVDDPALETRK